MIASVRIKSFEKGLYVKNGEFVTILGKGRHWKLNPFVSQRIDVVSQRDPWLRHPQLDMIVKSGQLDGLAQVIDLQDNQRALAWIDKRFATVLPPGQYAIWNTVREVKVEVLDVAKARFEHPCIDAIMKASDVAHLIEQTSIDEGQIGLYFLNGEFQEELPPGRYLFWRDAGKVKILHQDLREQVMDVSGQEIMTADKVSVRMNAVLTYQVKNALQAHNTVGDAAQAIYRETQLAIRAVVGTRELDAFLSDKDTVLAELTEAVRKRVSEFGIQIISLGIRDIILPGEMKQLLNKVTEARKAAEANLIARREEVAAVRSQANVAKLLSDNPALMRLRELEVLEQVASNSKLNVVLGERGLADRVVNLL